MCKYISFGEMNKLYKYIAYYLFFKLLYEYFFNPYSLPKDMAIKFLKRDVFINNNILVQGMFNYFGVFIFSLITYIYKNKHSKNLTKLKNPDISEKNISIALIYNEINLENITVSVTSVCSIILLYIICSQLKNTIKLLELKEINYWMFEILFICFMTSVIFKQKIYNYKKLSIGIIIFFFHFI